MTYPVFWKAIFTALAVSLCGAAHAASWSSARLTDLKITLVDLDPNDGITPAVSINLPGSPTSGYAELGRLFDEKTGSNSFDPLSLYLSNVSGYTEASISGSGPLTGMDLSADARVSDLPPGSGSSYSARVTMPRGMDPRPEIGFGLTLTPMTRLIWSADGVVHSELDADGYGYAYAGIQIHPHNVPASAGVTIRSVLRVT